MMHKEKINIGILGMGFYSPACPSLKALWSAHVNGEKMPDEPAQGETPALEKIIEATISAAAVDARISDGDGYRKRTRLVICCDSPLYGHQTDYLQSGITDTKVTLSWHNSSQAPGLSALKKVLHDFLDSDADCLILCAAGTPHAVDCGALVFGKTETGSSSCAYAVLDQFTDMDFTDAELELKNHAQNGLGYLLAVAGSDTSSHRAVDYNSAPMPLPENLDRSFMPYGTVCGSGPVTGTADVLKALMLSAMSLNGKIIPASLNKVTSSFLIRNTNIYLNEYTRPWIQDSALGSRSAAVAGISSGPDIPLVILSEVDPENPDQGFSRHPEITGLKVDTELIALSGKDCPDLQEQIQALWSVLQDPTVEMAEAACFLADTFDNGLSHRLLIIADTKEALLVRLEGCFQKLQNDEPDFEADENIYFTADAAEKTGKLACLFPGLGFPGLLGPYIDNLMALCLHFPEVRSVFDLVDARDHQTDDATPSQMIFFPPSAFSEEDRNLLRKRLASPRIEDDDTKDPAKRNLSSFSVTLANWAGWQLLKKLNVVPDGIFGQSLGEFCALCAGGTINFQEFISIFWDMPITSEDYRNGGRLALTGAGEALIRPFLEQFDAVYIAIHVAPEFQILGGEIHQLKEMVAVLKEQGVWTQYLPYPAIHTPELTSLRSIIVPQLDALSVARFGIPVYSGMTCDVYPDDEPGIRKTMTANIDHPVLLWQTTQKMYDDGFRIMVQVGGGAKMYSQAKTNISRSDLTALSLDVDYRSALTQVNHLCAALLAKGVDVNIRHLFEHRGLQTDRVAHLFRMPPATPPDDMNQPDMPFLGRILKFDDHSEIVTERVIDLNRDVYINDHLFIHAASVKHPSACLPVVPMTVSLEIMAEAAACLAPGCGLLGFENIRAGRWIALTDTENLNIQTVAKAFHKDPYTGTCRVAVAVFTPENEKPAIEGTVLMGSQYLEELDLEFSPFEADIEYPFRPEDVYGERHLFHGPVFQCITGETAIAGNKIIGELAVLPKTEMFSSGSIPSLLCDPILLDGVGQLAGLWAIEKGQSVFPVGIEKLEIYASTPDEGVKVPVLIEIKFHNAKLMNADIEIQDGNGGVWIRIKGWKAWVFKWSKALSDFRRQPEYYLTSRIMSTPDLPENAAMQYVSIKDIKEMELDWLARFYLVADEIKMLYGFEKPEQQWQWIMERIAAKDAVRRLLAGKSPKMIHPAAVVMTDQPGGDIVLTYPQSSRNGLMIRVASSSQGAVALVTGSEPNTDLERVLSIIEKPYQTEAGASRLWS